MRNEIETLLLDLEPSLHTAMSEVIEALLLEGRVEMIEMMGGTMRIDCRENTVKAIEKWLEGIAYFENEEIDDKPKKTTR